MICALDATDCLLHAEALLDSLDARLLGDDGSVVGAVIVRRGAARSCGEQRVVDGACAGSRTNNHSKLARVSNAESNIVNSRGWGETSEKRAMRAGGTMSSPMWLTAEIACGPLAESAMRLLLLRAGRRLRLPTVPGREGGGEGDEGSAVEDD
eukprot:1665467-Pleurochrysis_carterae.AAC.1